MLSTPLPRRRWPVCASQVFAVLALIFSIGAGSQPARSQAVGPSVNMVTGTQWPTGDPFLQRQNEPSMAVSSRNPLHLLGGSNDYRTVDLPFPVSSDEPTGDAWLGVFRSSDGGNSWQSTLLPGYPQDTSTVGMSSPLHSYGAAADPTVRAGTNGLFYYAGLAFNRDPIGTSAIFLARYVDDNVSGGNGPRYLGASLVAQGDSNHFLDKPYVAVDIPRTGSPPCTIAGSSDGSVPAATIQAGRIYVAYTMFAGDESSAQSSIMFSWSNDCGLTWTKPTTVNGSTATNQGAALAIDPNTGTVYVAWRVFKDSKGADQIAGSAFQYASQTFTPIISEAISPLDQGTTGQSFRTNAYPAIAVDGTGAFYVAWSQRGNLKDKTTAGDARITLIAGRPTFSSAGQITGAQVSGRITVDPYPGRGHQIMPAVAFSSGKLTVAWYDSRNDDHVATYNASGGGTYTSQELVPVGVTPQFSYYIADPVTYTSSTWRQTIDVRAAQAMPGLPPQFGASVAVSQYAFGSPDPSFSTAMTLPNDVENVQQLEFNAPNLPIFLQGTMPFLGDYIDVAGPTFLPQVTNGLETWRFNNLTSDPDHTHVVWTDNRNVVQPADNNWQHYTPVASTGGTSLFDPTQTRPACSPGQTGMRNQDIYTASVSSGLIMGSKGSYIAPSITTAGTAAVRQYPVTVENPTAQTLYYVLQIQNQPTNGTASFLQYAISGQPPLTTLQIGVLPYSSASRSVFITSTDVSPAVSVTATQTDANFNAVPNPLSSTTSLNSDSSNPSSAGSTSSTVEIYNPNIGNPNIGNPNIGNPNIGNPNIGNPNIGNVSFANTTIANPNIGNPNIGNPNIGNADIANPNIGNPNIGNTALSGEITDANYDVVNTGNTPSAYTLNLLQYQPAPAGVSVQLIVSGVYLTPLANACSLTVQAHYTPVLNVPNPTFLTVGSSIPSGPPDPLAPTFSLQPGEHAFVTLRVFDANASTPQQALQHYNPAVNIAPVVSSQAINTNLPAPSASTPPVPVLAVTSRSLTANEWSQFSINLQATGGVAPYTWTASSLPTGFSLSPDGVLSGSVAPGTYSLPVQVADQSGQAAQTTISLVVNVVTSAVPLFPSGQLPAPGVPNSYYVLPQATVGSAYTSAIPVYGGTPPYTWSQTGPLPDGLQFSAGVISGTPYSGSFSAPLDAASWQASASSGGSTTIAPNCLIGVTVTDQNNLTGFGLFEIGSTPSSSCLSFGYSIDLRNPATGTGSGVSDRTWTFTNVATASGTLSFHWRYLGFHAFFAVTAHLNLFVGSNPAITLYSAGPQDCCTPPSGSFDVEGDYSGPISAGQPLGFSVGGANGDSDSRVDGTLVLSNFSIR